jgi:uncharacterized protein (TIGR02453 family)
MIQTTTLGFLTILAKHNDKTWMDANRPAYLAAKADFETLVTSIIQQFATIDPELTALEAKNCIFRMNRDVRFSKNKAPYKTNMGASFSRGGKKGIFAGYYFHLEPGQSFVGGGLWMPMPPELKKVRQEIDYNPEDFQAILTDKAFKKQYGTLQGGAEHQLSRAPKGYPDDHPAIEWLRHKSFVAIKPLPDTVITGKQLISEIRTAFAALQPLISFLNTAVE